jgi:hypothetical protein
VARLAPAYQPRRPTETILCRAVYETLDGALLRDPAQPMHGGMLYDRDSGRFEPAPAAGGGTFGVLELRP